MLHFTDNTQLITTKESRQYAEIIMSLDPSDGLTFFGAEDNSEFLGVLSLIGLEELKS